MFAPVAGSALSGTLNGYMDSWIWRKCANGCSDYVSQVQSTQLLSNPDVYTLVSYLRIPTVYVDKTKFYVVFKITDQFGSPIFAQSAISVALTANINQYTTGLWCQTGNTLGDAYYATTQWLYYCSGDAVTSQFSNTQSHDTTLKLTASLDSVVSEMNVGGSNVALNKLTLSKTPDWWHATLRTDQDSSMAWPGPTTPVQDTVMTTPTYPLYADEVFEVKLYNYATYTLGDVYSLTFTVTYNSSVVTYVSFAQNSNFATFNVDVGTPNKVSYATLRFRVSSSQETTSDSGVSTGISVMFTGLANSGQNHVTSQHYSSVYDFRQESTYGGSGSGPEDGNAGGSTGFIHIKVARASDRAAFLHPRTENANTQDHGKLFNYRSIDGKNHDNIFEATVVTDRMSSIETNT
eukprot:7391760-Prymnesium_polylepis.1